MPAHTKPTAMRERYKVPADKEATKNKRKTNQKLSRLICDNYSLRPQIMSRTGKFNLIKIFLKLMPPRKNITKKRKK